MPWAAKSMVQIQKKARNFSLLPNIYWVPGFFPMGQADEA